MSNLAKLESYIHQLKQTSPGDGAFLIVTVSGTEDFLQMTGDSSGVQIDFPLVTARQMSFESRIRSTAELHGYALVENKGSDGSRFLDIDVNDSAQEIARVCEVLLREVFRAGESTRIEFDGDGIEFE